MGPTSRWVTPRRSERPASATRRRGHEQGEKPGPVELLVKTSPAREGSGPDGAHRKEEVVRGDFHVVYRSIAPSMNAT